MAAKLLILLPLTNPVTIFLDSLSDQIALLGATAQTAIAVALLCAMCVIGLFLCWRLDQ
jgi:hypothetical protein